MNTETKKSQKRVQPRILRGFRDYDPGLQLAKERLQATARLAAESRGFLPLQTPAIEHAETLLGSHYSAESLSELFGFQGPDETDMALRYEFTVSLARYVSMQPNLAMPFRRYQYGPVWRYDKPGPGRFREFTQFDLDCIGTSNLLADAEVISTMVSILKSAREKITVHVSNRKILNGLNEWAGIPPEKSAEVMRVIDKLSKQGREAVRLELGPGRVDSSGDKIAGLKLEDSLIHRLDLFLDLAEKEQSDPLAAVGSLLEMHESAVAGAKELRELFGLLDLLGVEEASRKIDLTIVRGLGYYTGPVFECTLNRLPEFGSVFSGGRYDNLLERFSSVQAPAVGASIGVDRLLAALEQLSTISKQEATAIAVITIMDQDRLADYIELSNELRNKGIAVELYQGDQKGVGKQMKYADKVGIPFAVIIGSDEWANNTVTVKNLVAGRSAAEGVSDRDAWLKSAGEVQVTIPRGKLVEHLRQFQQATHTSGRKA